jgi:hypothetical protein
MLAFGLTLLILAADPAAPGDASGAAAPDAVVVAPAALLPALQPLIAHREALGHRFAFVSNKGSAETIRKAIQQHASGGALKYVLLVGDADPAARVDARVAARSVPTHFHKAVVNVKWGSEPQIAADNYYADLDGDDLPDLAVGRLPADSSEELGRVVAKILAYEANADFGAWRQRVNFIAGVGGFSPLIDGVLETATSKLLTSGIPPEYETRMTYGSWRSPYCPDPRLFHATTVERHNEGCLFWVYIGHGHSRGLDRVSVPGERFHIFDIDDCRELRASGGSPIAIMLACHTAAFDQPQDCLGEELLRTEGGPVAVYGGSRVTMPYAMGVMGTALMDEYFQQRPATLGDAIVAAKRQMMREPDENDPLGNVNRLLLDGVASVISPSRELMQEERREHLHLFNLLGDPMLRLSYPEAVVLRSPRQAMPGDKVRIEGRTELAGEAVLEIVCRRDRLKHGLPLRERFDPTDRGLEKLHETYVQTLDRAWGRWALDLPAGDFATEITVPDDCRGPCHVRLLVAGEKSHALGSVNLLVQPQAAERGKAAGPTRR